MKYYFLLFLSIILSGNIYGQIVVADTPHCHYIVLHSDFAGLVPTSSGITADDNWSAVVPIGFTFNFYGLPNTQCIIGSNGCLGFELANALAYNTWPIGNTLLGSTAAAPDVINCICGPWCDVYIPAGGTIDYSMQGVAPFRNFAVTWCGTAMYSCTTQWLTTQIIIYETTGIAEVHIGHHTFCTSWNGGYAICGVKDPTGTIATTAPGRDYPANWAVTDEAWRFTPSGTTYTVSSIPYAPIPYASSTVYWYDSTTHAYLGSGSDFTITPTVPGTYAAAVIGCQDTAWGYVHVTASDIAYENSCFQAYSNAPCQGDSLLLWETGDSTGDTYIWSGPDGFTSTQLSPFIYPATLANSGTYYLYRHVGLTGVNDTSSVVVTVNPTPVISMSSNAPLCAGMTDTLVLNVTPATAGETFSWSGPDGFTSTEEGPTVPGFSTPNIGNYSVLAISAFGCRDSGTIYAGTVPPPPPPPFTGQTQYCYGSTFIPFSASGGGVVYYAATGGAPLTSPPSVNTFAPGISTFYATQQIGSCVSPMDSISILVYPRIDPNFSYIINRGCNGDTVIFTNLSANSDSFTWSFGDATPPVYDSTSALLSHTHIYAVRDTYDVYLWGYNPVCPGDTVIPVDTRHNVIASFWPTPDTFCLNYATQFVNYSVATLGGPPSPPFSATAGTIVSQTWNFGDGSAPNTSLSPSYTYNAPGTYTATLSVTDAIGCSDTATEKVFVMQLYVNSFTDTTLCLGLPLPMANNWSEYPIGIVAPQFTWTQSRPNLSDTSIQIPSLTGFGQFVDTLTITLPGVKGNPGDSACPIRDTITVNSVSGQPVTNLTVAATIVYGSSIQLNADNEVKYYWQPDNGTLNNPNINDPIATPSVTTTYTVYGLDIYGCLDSASVTINVDTSETGGMPSAFTPNDDGLNDIYRIPPSADRFANMVQFSVFNRWGQMVFNTNNKSVGWDGKYQGVPQDMGSYFYVIIVASPGGENITYKGTLTLIR